MFNRFEGFKGFADPAKGPCRYFIGVKSQNYIYIGSKPCSVTIYTMTPRNLSSKKEKTKYEMDKSISEEFERSLRVAREKLAHGSIEEIERKRKFSDTLSIMLRITTLLNEINAYDNVFNKLYSDRLPEEHAIYLQLKEVVNKWSQIYNSIHDDIRQTYGLGEKFDAQFPKFSECPPYKSRLVKQRDELRSWLSQLFSFLARKFSW